MAVSSFVVIDFEKLNSSPLSVCEVGLVKYIEGVKVDELHRFIKPYGDLARNPWAKTHLKHISDVQLQNAPTFSELYPEMLQFVGGNLFVCQSKGADLNYIYHNEKEFHLQGLYDKFIDIQKITGKGWKEAYKERFGKQVVDEHHALADAQQEAELFAALVASEDVSKYIECDYIPADEKPKNFAKSNSKSTDDIPLDDAILDNYDFLGKKFVVSGVSPYRAELKKRYKSTDIHKSDALVIGATVGESKIAKAMSKRQNNPGTFYIFSQEAVAKKLGIEI